MSYAEELKLFKAAHKYESITVGGSLSYSSQLVKHQFTGIPFPPAAAAAFQSVACFF